MGCPGQLTRTTTIPHGPLDILQAQEQVRHRGGDRRAHRGSNPGRERNKSHDWPQQLGPQVQNFISSSYSIPSTNCIFMIDLYTLKQKFCSPVPISTRHAIIARKLVELIGFPFQFALWFWARSYEKPRKSSPSKVQGTAEKQRELASSVKANGRRSFFFIFLIYEKIVPLETKQYHIEVRNWALNQMPISNSKLRNFTAFNREKNVINRQLQVAWIATVDIMDKHAQPTRAVSLVLCMGSFQFWSTFVGQFIDKSAAVPGTQLFHSAWAELSRSKKC